MKAYVFRPENGGSLEFEWIDKEYRFGISVDLVKPEESSWYFVSVEHPRGDVRECGKLTDEMLKLLIAGGENAQSQFYSQRR